MSVSVQEKILLLKLQKKDSDAFAQLYDAYVTPIYRFIYIKVTNQQIAEDLTSEVFLKTWQYITETSEEVKSIKALLYRIARNAVIDFYRQRAANQTTGDEDVLLNIEDNRQQNILSRIETVHDLKTIEQVLRRMKDEYREVILLRFVEELSITEIATILHKPKGAVRVLLHRALKVARELLENERPGTNQKN